MLRLSKKSISGRFRGYFDGSKRGPKVGAGWVIYANGLEPKDISTAVAAKRKVRFAKPPFADNPSGWLKVAWAAFALPASYSALDAEFFAMSSMTSALVALCRGRLDVFISAPDVGMCMQAEIK